MSTFTATTWTCDRCGAKTEVSAHRGEPEQPYGWGALWLVRPPLMAPADSGDRPDQVCVDCVASYLAWLAAPGADVD